MSEPCPPAFMRTAPPIDPGTPTAHSKPVSPAAQFGGRAPAATPAPPAVTTCGAESKARPDRCPTPCRRATRRSPRTRRRPRACSNPARGSAPAGRTRAGHRRRAARSSSDAGRANNAAAPTDPVGGAAAPIGTSRSPSAPRRLSGEIDGVGHRLRHGCSDAAATGEQSTSSGSVRDVAAAHRDADVAGPDLLRHEADEVVPARQPHDACSGWASARR